MGFMRHPILLLITLTFLTTSVAFSQDHLTKNTLALGDNQMPEATLTDASWLVGSWSGAAMNGTAEEIWAPPSGGSMLGMFKYVEEGETIFSEIMTIIPTGTSIEMRLKHFSADMTGWEEKDEYESFPLVKITGEALYFDGLTVRKSSADAITIIVATENKDGSFSELAFPYKRTQL